LHFCTPRAFLISSLVQGFGMLVHLWYSRTWASCRLASPI